MRFVNIFIPLLMLMAVGIGNAAEKTVTKAVSVASGFTSIDVANGIQVIYTPSASVSVKVTATAEDMEGVKFVRSGSTLKIYRKMEWFGHGGRNKVIVTMSAPALKEYEVSSGASIEITSGVNLQSESIEVEASSGGSVSANGITCRSLEVETSSGASVNLVLVKAESVEVEASSGSSARVTGSCTSAGLTASSGASISAGELKASSGKVSASSGAGVSSAIANLVRSSKSSGGSIRNSAK